MTRLMDERPVMWRRHHKLQHRGRKKRTPKPREDRIGDFFTWFRSLACHSSNRRRLRYGPNGYCVSPRQVDGGALCVFYHHHEEFAGVLVTGHGAEGTRVSANDPVLYLFDEHHHQWLFRSLSRDNLADFLASMSIGATLNRVLSTVNMRRAESAIGLPR